MRRQTKRNQKTLRARGEIKKWAFICVYDPDERRFICRFGICVKEIRWSQLNVFLGYDSALLLAIFFLEKPIFLLRFPNRFFESFQSIFAAAKKLNLNT